MNNEIIELIKKRDKLYRLWKTKPNDTDRHSNFKKVRNQINKKVNWAKNNYFKNKFLSVQSDPKKTWQIINEIIGKSSVSIDEAICKSMKENNTSLVADRFAKKFEEDVRNTVHECRFQSTSESTRCVLSNSLALLDTNEEEIFSILSKLNRNKGAGGDGIRPKDLAEHV